MSLDLQHSNSTDEEEGPGSPEGITEFHVAHVDGSSGSEASEEEAEDPGQEQEDNEVLFMNEGIDDSDGKLVYLYWCDKLKLPPVSQVLKYLNGTSVNVNHYLLSENGLRALAYALRVNSSVVSVELGDNNLSDSALTAFFNILSGNSVIQHINLSGNRLGSSGCQALARFLEGKECQLKTLLLSKNRLTDRHIKRLIEAFGVNETLECVDLSRNQLTGKTAGTNPAQCRK